MRCDLCQSLLLDHLYGLLDPSEAATVEAHLAGCVGCTAARESAARVQGLVTRAAKFTFPNVQFVAPSEEPAERAVPPSTVVPRDEGHRAAPVVPSEIARAPRLSRRVVWVRWVVAASLLALIPGTLLPLGAWSARYQAARVEVDDSVTRLADAKAAVERAQGGLAGTGLEAEKQLLAAQQRADAVLAEWVAAERSADRQQAMRKISVDVAKPVSVQPGAPNDFVVTLKGAENAPQESRIEAEVRDQAGSVLFAQQLDRENASSSHRVRLPATLWSKVRPDSELFLTVAAIDNRTGTRTELQDKVRLMGPVFTTLLTTDKASYRPGERLFFRSLTLDRVTFRPPSREQVLQFSLRKPNGQEVSGTSVSGTTEVVRTVEGRIEPVVGPDGKPVRGVGCGAIVLPADLPDGDYSLTVSELPGPGETPPLSLPAARTVKVRSGAAERYAKRLGFRSTSYAPGQAVEAWVELSFQGKPVQGAVVSGVATADGKAIPVVRPVPRTTGSDGRTVLKFNLPPATEMPRGDVRLMATFRTAEGEESIAERVPVAGHDVVVEFFPEGGKMVAGVPCRLYVRATTPGGRPVGIRGVVVEGSKTVARVDSLTDADEPGVNRGLASFTFTPQAETVYRLKFEGREGPGFDLPRAEADGVVMAALDPVTAPGQPIRVRLYSARKTRDLVVGAYVRGRLVDLQRTTVKPGEAPEVRLATSNDPRGGVTRVTVFEQPTGPNQDLAPVAERLVFRKPGEILNLTLDASSSGEPFSRGSPVDLTVAAKDEKGSPVAAILWAAAVNSAVTPGAHDRSLPTHFLLAGEVQTPDDLEYADFLLTDHPKAAAALDLVLATQGWRRFVEQAGPTEIARQPANQRRTLDAARLLVLNGQYPVVAESSESRKRQELHETYWPRYEEAARDLSAARRAKGEAATEGPHRAAIRDLFAAYESRRRETTELAAAARSVADQLVVVRRWSNWAAGGLAVLAGGLVVFTVARPAGTRGNLPLIVAACGAGGLAVLLAFYPSSTTVVADVTVPPELNLAAPASTPARDSAAPAPAPDQSPSPGSVGPLVKAPTIAPAKEETRVLSGVGNPLVPPKSPRVTSTADPLLGVFAPIGPDSRSLIPDDRLRHVGNSVRGTEKGVRASSVHAEEDRQLTEKVGAYAAGRRSSFASQLESVSPELRQDADAYNRLRSAVPLSPPLVVREYAAPRPGSANGSFADADTVLWQPLIVLPTDGKATLSFHLGDAPGGYQVVVAGHTLDGRIGSTRLILPVAPPAPVAPKSSK